MEDRRPTNRLDWNGWRMVVRNGETKVPRPPVQELLRQRHPVRNGPWEEERDEAPRWWKWEDYWSWTHLVHE
eukprot:scaffold135672_cov38-Attheya_sp.AAC.1